VPSWLQNAIPIIAATVAVMAVLYRLDRRLDRIEAMSRTIEYQNRAILRTFTPVISALISGKRMTVQEGTALIANALEAPSISDVLDKIKPTVNPLSRADLDRLNAYVARLKMGQSLSPVEAQDFYRLTDIVTHEYPAQEGSWLLWVIAGVLLGAILKEK
jgi:hypothetical protein